MKRKVLKAISISLALTCILLVTGCDALQSVGGKSKVIVEFKSPDGKQTLSAPDSWKSMTELNPIADIQIANLVQEKYVIVINEVKGDMTLSDYTTNTKENVLAAIANATITDVEDIVVNGNKAQYYEASGEVGEVKATYILITVETADKLHQIIGWTLTSRFEKNKEEIKEVMNSFKVE